MTQLSFSSITRRSLGCCVTFLLLSALLESFFFRVGRAGEEPVEPPEAREAMETLKKELRQALSVQDEERTRAVVRRMIRVLGPRAGKAEPPPRYYSPIEKGEPDLEKVEHLWLEIDRRLRTRLPWVINPEGDPYQFSSGLRSAARPVIAYCILSRPALGSTGEYKGLAKAGAEYLLKMQKKNGLFPFPDIRNRHPLFGPMIDKLLKRKPSALDEGWIIQDLTGDLQYDNAICGVAMLEYYQLTQQKEYLESAKKACEWASKQPLALNWNYNAFSVWLLARYAQASDDRRYLDSALQKTRVGVLPGQMENGRWFDPHNARLVYHAILVRGLLAVYQALDREDPARFELYPHLTKGLDNAAHEICSLGASSVSIPTETLCEAIEILGPNPLWEQALKININAGLHVLEDSRAPNVGVYLPYYLYHLKKHLAEGVTKYG